MLVNVDRPDIANSYETFVSVHLVALANNVLALDKPLKGLPRQLPALLLLALAGPTGLLHLQRVDAMQADAFPGDFNGVPVDDTGFAGTKTDTFIKATKTQVHVPLSEQAMEFDANGKCMSGC